MLQWRAILSKGSDADLKKREGKRFIECWSGENKALYKSFFNEQQNFPGAPNLG